jgi:hypothetical protein
MTFVLYYCIVGVYMTVLIINHLFAFIFFPVLRTYYVHYNFFYLIIKTL